MPSPAEIREARLSAGLTQQQAGAVIGASRRTWQNWELGSRNMPPAKWELFNLKTKGEKMRSVTIKTLCGNNDSSSTIAPDASPLGNFREASLQVRRVNNIPASVDNAQVLRLFRETSDISWLGGKEPRLEYDFSEIGNGKIIR